jgi:hypothetical protein
VGRSVETFRAAAAGARLACQWRQLAIERFEAANGRTGCCIRGAVAAAVLSGLAVSVSPESGLRPGMRALGPADSFPELPSYRIGTR